MSIYLSRLTLNPRSRAARRDLADCHQLHRTILRAFPQAEENSGGARQQFGVLFRVDIHPRSGQPVVLVQSVVAPDWSHLADGYLLRPPECKEVGGAYDQLRAGDELVFRLRANPTKRIKQQTDPEGKKWDGKRVELQREEDQLAWLERKAADHGFKVLTVQAKTDPSAAERVFGITPKGPREVPDARPIPNLKVTGHKGDRRSEGTETETRQQLFFGAVVFEGRLAVTDIDCFRLALERGIGSAKAYGFGLLSIARAPST